jgi:hypothetical protein
MGDLDGIVETAQRLEQGDPQLRPFARKLAELAEGCELNALTALLKQLMPDCSPELIN